MLEMVSMEFLVVRIEPGFAGWKVGSSAGKKYQDKRLGRA